VPALTRSEESGDAASLRENVVRVSHEGRWSNYRAKGLCPVISMS
jgi:hypothetical protein